MNQHIYNKYSQNQIVSFNEILDDFSQIKPTFNPILDICIIKILGGYIYNIKNFQKWKMCPNIMDEITSYNINNSDIVNIINKASYNDPSHTINKVYYHVSDTIKNSLNMNNKDDVYKYFEMKSNYNDFLNTIKIKYQESWSDIEKQYDIITNTLLDNFKEIDDDLNYQLTTELIDSIGSEASEKVNKLINMTSKLHKIDFDKQMDQIYEQVISSKNFDKLIHDVLLDIYGVEKAIHRMALSLDNCSNMLNNYIKQVS